MHHDNGGALEKIIPNGCLYCSLTGAVLSQSPGLSFTESTDKVSISCLRFSAWYREVFFAGRSTFMEPTLSNRTTSDRRGFLLRLW